MSRRNESDRHDAALERAGYTSTELTEERARMRTGGFPLPASKVDACDRCESGDITGTPCEHRAAHKHRYVPAWLRGTARAARSDAGLTRTIQVCADCAEMLEEQTP